MTEPVAGVEPLLELFARCVVRVEVDGTFRGTGFYVAPGEVLTCAHVVHGGTTITIGDGWLAEPLTALLHPDDPRARRFYPQPDAVLLHVPDAPAGHPCVPLTDQQPATTDPLQLSAWVRSDHAPGAVARSGAALRLETTFDQDGWTLYQLREGQVIKGFSGGPVLNRRTGQVCALIDATRAERSDLGGFGVPIGAIATLDPELLARNAAFHAGDPGWAGALIAQRVAEDERAEKGALLPLLPPILDLPSGRDVAASDLLRPRYAVVPFVARGDLLDHAMRWREADTALDVLVLTGAGGFGKTRTAAEVCRAAEQSGWTAGLLDGDDDTTPLLTWRGRLLVAVDYAETRPEPVTDLLRRLLRRRSGPPVRVVLIVRQGGGRQSLIDLFATGDAADDVRLLLQRAELVGLGRGQRELDRRRLFATAATALAARLDVDATAPATAPDLYAEHFERPLIVLAAALLRVPDPQLRVAEMSPEQLLAEILDRHEAAYWERSDQRRSLGLLPAARRTVVALTAMCGLAGGPDDEQLIQLVPSLRETSPERAARIRQWLTDLYGPTGTLEPDLLAEVLIARVITDTPALVGAVLDGMPDPQLTRALVVLSRVAARSEPGRVAIRDALDDRLPALVGRAARADLADTATALTLAVGAAGPVTGAVHAQYDLPLSTPALGQLGIEIGRVAIDGLRTARERDPDQVQRALATALDLQATTWLTIGRPAEGLTPIEEAVAIRRRLARPTLTRSLADLAASLNNQANLLGRAGRPADGLTRIDEAVTLYRRLAQADATRFLPDLAAALSNQANRLGETGRFADGLAPIDEAVAIRRRLAQADPTHFQPDLAAALNNQAEALRLAGRPADGLGPIDEAVTIRRRLAQADPTRFQPDLAGSLSNQSNLLAQAGRPTDALAPIDEAIAIRRRLVQTDPTRFQPNLATELNNRSSHLAHAGRPADALAPIDEAATLYRGLTQADPTRFQADLAMSLNNQSNHLADTGRPADALAPIDEAVTIRRRLAQADPTRFLPDLAGSLNNQSNRLADTGRPADGLAPIEEAVALYRRLAQADPTRFQPELALSLNNRCNHLARAGRLTDAVASIDEAVTIRRRLTQVDPTRFLPDLAFSLNNQSYWLAEIGRPADALASIDEAVTIRRPLAQADPTRFQPDLAMSLSNQFNQLAEAGRRVEADTAFAAALADHPAGWPRAVLLRARAQCRQRIGELTTAIADAAEAATLFSEVGDRRRRGQARALLRELHDAAGREPIPPDSREVPVWLRHRTTDDHTTTLITEWIAAPTWGESFDFLTQHAETLLTDRTEAGLEHPIDDDPDRSELDRHLAILHMAREHGIDATRSTVLQELRIATIHTHLSEWTATETWPQSADYLTAHADALLTDDTEHILVEGLAAQPELLRYLGLLGLARTIGIQQAHEMITTPDTQPSHQSAVALPQARLNAGMHIESAEAQFTHALTALRAANPAEAVWAMRRCHDASASWEWAPFLRRLNAFATTHPDLDTNPLVSALTGATREASEAMND